MLGRQVFGLNISGAEGGKFNSNDYGVYGHDYIYPSTSFMQRTVDRLHPGCIRLPIRWERIQPQVMGPLDPSELQRLHTTVLYFTSRRVRVLVEVHNYGSRRLSPSTASQYISKYDNRRHFFNDLWARLGVAFGLNQFVDFGLMNEPQTIDPSIQPIEQAFEWLNNISQGAINSIRRTGATNYIFVPHYKWQGAHDFFASASDEAFLDLRDPLSKLVLDLHQYLDQWNSGHSGAAVPGKGASVLAPVTSWALRNGVTVAITETGSYNKNDYPGSEAEVVDFYTHVRNNPSVYFGIYYWGYGPWYAERSTSGAKDQNYLGFYTDGSMSPGLALIEPWLS